jgi:hypothetical protein
MSSISTTHQRPQITCDGSIAGILPFKAVFANGFTPLPNRDKACRLPGWNRIVVDQVLVNRWTRSSLPAMGIRVEPPLMVVDADIPDDVIMPRITAAIERTAPAVLEGLKRIGRPPKAAYFLRLARPGTGGLFHWLATERFATTPTPGPGEPTFRVEVFGGGGKAHQFGAFGVHSTDKQGVVLHRYRWVGLSPADVAIDLLPEVPEAQIWAMLEACEAVLRDCGLVPVATMPGARADGRFGTVYDLEPTTVLETEDGAIKAAELEAALAAAKHAGHELRVTGSFLHEPGSSNSLRAKVTMSGDGVQVTDFKWRVHHRMRDAEPPPIEDLIAFGNLIDRITRED